MRGEGGADGHILTGQLLARVAGSELANEANQLLAHGEVLVGWCLVDGGILLQQLIAVVLVGEHDLDG
eukprot:CAMPEP_0174355196 /NCGR_PEP_ID=MMETSP0811_2-20130205/23198_1 /TAXON_ID=73025 ORGANISM="Eutreptiella gymnastica-like, Strain CCMP1594" /NCGR_SAMPLE_ID=MMETSP0811_2 /ASSEMBLY_ACC=CAM_ASM_000667 /LENGTH=67 /DNA_ID=CAMNT_0015486415 /DNA_START=666 /DNA_END=866 /DNA_ORIENTATION=-